MGSASEFFLGMAALLLMPSIAHIVLAQNDPSDWVTLHNDERSKVGVGPVSWDEEVAAFAESYANQDITVCKTRGHSGDRAATASDAMSLWASEGDDFDKSTKTCAEGKECGHYTQVVWRDSTAIGCARAVCNDVVFIICNYSPPGNVDGQDPF
ncbi:unnamed protein product [Spirodela intermedia]|uniref:SCP domain-containing protein n=1 Tax=Spirodela intermedia TaxID=51605 RepID=A0A7I8IDI3_SPIIN|nr:unnamed protein product [Spirodela intermedia]CAA6655719.1 unnamed protein product [Spirodela intermedia]